MWWIITWLACIVGFLLPAFVLAMVEFVRQEREMRDELFE